MIHSNRNVQNACILKLPASLLYFFRIARISPTFHSLNCCNFLSVLPYINKQNKSKTKILHTKVLPQKVRMSWTEDLLHQLATCVG